jgi:hypothetical protein
MKKFFKSLPVIVIALALLSVAGIAGLLSYYGKVVGTATVNQSVVVDGEVVPGSMNLHYSINGVKGGETFTTDEHTIKDQSSVDASITITSQIEEASCPQGAQCTTDSAIEIKYYTFKEVIGTGDGSKIEFEFKPMMQNPQNVKATDGTTTVDCTGPDTTTGKYTCTFPTDKAPSQNVKVYGIYNVNSDTALGTVTAEKELYFTFSAKTKVNAIPGSYVVTTTIAPRS